MPKLAEVQEQKTAGFIQKGSARARRAERMKRDEEELEALLSGENQNESEEEAEEDVVEEVTNKAAAEPEEEDKSLSSEEQSFKKRYGDLRRHSQEKERKLQEQITALEGRLDKAEGMKELPATDEELEAWATQYPDAARIVETLAAKKVEQSKQQDSKRLEQIEAQHEEVKRVKAESEIRNSHADFDDLRASDEFHSWVEDQPTWIQDALYKNENDAVAVIRVLDLYKVDTGQTVAQKKIKAKELASEVKVKEQTEIDADDKPTYSESQIQKNSDKWYEKHESAIMAAMQDGRFNYDMSGGAR